MNIVESYTRSKNAIRYTSTEMMNHQLINKYLIDSRLERPSYIQPKVVLTFSIPLSCRNDIDILLEHYRNYTGYGIIEVFIGGTTGYVVTLRNPIFLKSTTSFIQYDNSFRLEIELMYD